jgi:hypothetical protein
VKKYAGLLLLALVAAVVLGWHMLYQQAQSLTVTGRAGGEKIGFLQDPEVQKLLQRRYSLVVKAQKYGSVEMVTEPATGLHFLWPGSEVDLEYYRERGGQFTQSHNIFHSPLVLYSWDVVTEGLNAHGMVSKRAESYYVTDFPKLLRLIEARTGWAELGLPQLYGSLKIIATDPVKSNSGNSFAGLLANLMNGGEVVTFTDEQRLTTLLTRLQNFFARLGFLEHTSGVLWDKFISQGAGAYPLIVGYENQIIEYSLEHPEARDVLRQKVRVLYPQPTVWSSHPFIALDATGARLLQALQDKDLQRLAWERHGFRSGLLGTANDVAPLTVIGLPKVIEAAMPTPHATVMQRLLEALSATRPKAPSG